MSADRVSRADVLRIVERDYPTQDRAAILALLDSCASSPEPERVHLAILKLARGSTSAVASGVARAAIDYRDILAGAEYPRTMSLGFDDPTRERECREEDRREYEAWLRASLRSPRV